MMPTIRIDDDVFQGLKQLAEPFSDTPNSVIRRLLQERSGAPTANSNVASLTTEIKAKPNSAAQKKVTEVLTPQPVYEEFLIHVLSSKFGGRAGKQQATEAVLKLMKSYGYLGSADYQVVSTGETRAQNTIAWARQALKTRGLIRNDSLRGNWELTKEGYEAASHITLKKK